MSSYWNRVLDEAKAVPKGEIDVQVAQLKELRSMNGKITLLVILAIINPIVGPGGRNRRDQFVLIRGRVR